MHREEPNGFFKERKVLSRRKECVKGVRDDRDIERIIRTKVCFMPLLIMETADPNLTSLINELSSKLLRTDKIKSDNKQNATSGNTYHLKPTSISFSATTLLADKNRTIETSDWTKNFPIVYSSFQLCGMNKSFSYIVKTLCWVNRL